MFKPVSPSVLGRALKFAALPAALLAVIALFYFWQLGSSTAGLSSAELNYAKSNSSWPAIVESPLYGPHRASQALLIEAGLTSQFYLRLPSVAFMLVFIGFFYLLVRIWFGRLVGILGTLMLAGTPWIVVVAKNAVPDILLLAPLALISSYLWLSRRQTKINTMWIVLMVLLGLSLYVPGMIWFYLAALASAHRQLFNITVRISKWSVAGGLLIFGALTAPLIRALVYNPAILKDLFLIPKYLDGPLDIAKSIGWSVLSLVWRLPNPTDLTVGRLPLMTISLLALAAFGVYAMWARARRQAYGLAGLIAGSVFFAGLNDQLTLLLPAVMALCVLAAAGLRYLFVEWNSIFPRNPLPRYTAVIFMSVLIGLHMFYGFRYAQIAWPNSPPTKRVYVLKYESQ